MSRHTKFLLLSQSTTHEIFTLKLIELRVSAFILKGDAHSAISFHNIRFTRKCWEYFRSLENENRSGTLSVVCEFKTQKCRGKTEVCVVYCPAFCKYTQTAILLNTRSYLCAWLILWIAVKSVANGFCLNILFRFPSSPGLLTSSCTSCETFVCFRMASRTAAEGDAVWQGGGLHQFDDRDRPRASESHPESPAHHEPECKGEGLLRTSALFTFLTLIFSDFPFQSFLFGSCVWSYIFVCVFVFNNMYI